MLDVQWMTPAALMLATLPLLFVDSLAQTAFFLLVTTGAAALLSLRWPPIGRWAEVTLANAFLVDVVAWLFVPYWNGLQLAWVFISPCLSVLVSLTVCNLNSASKFDSVLNDNDATGFGSSEKLLLLLSTGGCLLAVRLLASRYVLLLPLLPLRPVLAYSACFLGIKLKDLLPIGVAAPADGDGTCYATRRNSHRTSISANDLRPAGTSAAPSDSPRVDSSSLSDGQLLMMERKHSSSTVAAAATQMPSYFFGSARWSAQSWGDGSATEHLLNGPISSAAGGGLISAEAVMAPHSWQPSRRVSLPATSSLRHRPLHSAPSFYEARSVLNDMLSWSSLPPQVAAGLRALNALISPNQPSTPELRIAEDPLTGRTFTVPYGCGWSTVTAATGLPTLEPEPSRSRDTTFWKKRQDSDSLSPIRKTSSWEKDNTVKVYDGTIYNQAELDQDAELAQLHLWSFPVFDLILKYPSTIMSRVAYRVFSSTGLFRIFRIPRRQFFNYFHALEMGYWDIPYHNRMHACDVLQGCFYLCTNRLPSVADCSDSVAEQRDMSGALSALELLALFTAAAMHDFDHPGRTNAFLVATKDPKAILYNDRSVLENHHAAASWRLLCRQDNDFIAILDAAERRRFRFLVLEAILATDLKRHFEILDEVNVKTNADGLNWDLEGDRLLAMQLCIKLADIASPTRTRNLHRQWTDRIVEEFFMQGDDERALGLPVSAYMDRAHPSVPKLQDSFIAHVVSPLLDAMAQAGLLPLEEDESESQLQVNLTENHKMWLNEIETSLGAASKQSPTASEMDIIQENDEPL